MENKCNKTPNKYLDHVYCQSGEGKNYMRASNGNDRIAGGGGSTNADLVALLKENKQLKAMLILHLDLIQEQSDQILAKDKQLCSLREDLQAAQSKNAQLETQIQELQRQIQRQVKRTATTPLGEQALLSPPPLAKIQCKKENSSSPTNIIGECNGKLITKIILQRVNLPDGTVIETHPSSPNSTTISDTASEETAANLAAQEEENELEDIEEMITTEDSDDGTIETVRENIDEDTTTTTTTNETCTVILSAAPATPTLPVQICVTPPTRPSRGKQMPLMLWHAPNMHSEEEESGSGEESTAGTEQHENTAVLVTSTSKKSEVTETPKTRSRKSTKDSQADRHQSLRSAQAQQQTEQQTQQQTQKHKRRCVYMTSEKLYPTREWETEDEAVYDFEFSQAEAEALNAEAPMLEIPKWTEHELTPSYCIEGTEDLSEESFIKRHAKLEVDERRRKKWDVQQIREQRRIEKLKRRHCKNEMQANEQQFLKSFYPQPESLQTICIADELPVMAFGELIPKLPSGEFALPWLLQTDSSATNSKTDTTAATTTTSSSITEITKTTTALITPTITAPITTTPIHTTTATTTTATTTPTTTTATTFSLTTSSSVEIMANSTAANSTSAQAQAQMFKSSFVFLKKRRRQQSSSAAAAAGGTTHRQRTSTVVGKGSQQSAAATGTAVAVPTAKNANALETEVPTEESVSQTVEEKK